MKKARLITMLVILIVLIAGIQSVAGATPGKLESTSGNYATLLHTYPTKYNYIAGANLTQYSAKENGYEGETLRVYPVNVPDNAGVGDPPQSRTFSMPQTSWPAAYKNSINYTATKTLPLFLDGKYSAPGRVVNVNATFGEFTEAFAEALKAGNAGNLNGNENVYAHNVAVQRLSGLWAGTSNCDGIATNANYNIACSGNKHTQPKYCRDEVAKQVWALEQKVKYKLIELIDSRPKSALAMNISTSASKDNASAWVRDAIIATPMGADYNQYQDKTGYSINTGGTSGTYVTGQTGSMSWDGTRKSANFTIVVPKNATNRGKTITIGSRGGFYKNYQVPDIFWANMTDINGRTGHQSFVARSALNISSLPVSNDLPADTRTLTLPMIYYVSASAGGGGSITAPGQTWYDAGASPTYYFTPSAGYRVSNVIVDGVSRGAIPSFTFAGINADHSISVSFAQNIYSITGSAGPGGSINRPGVTQITHGGSVDYTFTPSTGYKISNVVVDGVSIGAVSSYTFSNVTANHTISVSFIPITYGIVSSAGPGGSISPLGTTQVQHGKNQSYTITPSPGYMINKLVVDKIEVPATGTYTFTNVTAPHTISVTFIQCHTITATATGGGSISPAGKVTVKHAGSQAFDIKPKAGWAVDYLEINGVKSIPMERYDFNNVVTDHTIHAAFKPIDASKPDLIVSSIKFDKPIYLDGEAMEIEATIKNQGGLATNVAPGSETGGPSAFNARITYKEVAPLEDGVMTPSMICTPDGKDTEEKTLDVVLPPGGTTTVTYHAIVDFSRIGSAATKHASWVNAPVEVFADSTDVVSESNEDNNKTIEYSPKLISKFDVDEVTLYDYYENTAIVWGGKVTNTTGQNIPELTVKMELGFADGSGEISTATDVIAFPKDQQTRTSARLIVPKLPNGVSEKELRIKMTIDPEGKYFKNPTVIMNTGNYATRVPIAPEIIDEFDDNIYNKGKSAEDLYRENLNRYPKEFKSPVGSQGVSAPEFTDNWSEWRHTPKPETASTDDDYTKYDFWVKTNTYFTLSTDPVFNDDERIALSATGLSMKASTVTTTNYDKLDKVMPSRYTRLYFPETFYGGFQNEYSTPHVVKGYFEPMYSDQIDVPNGRPTWVKNANGTNSASVEWKYPPNPKSVKNRAVHYPPLWFPDAEKDSWHPEEYVPNYMVQCWNDYAFSPLGRLNYGVQDKISIVGDLYDAYSVTAK